MDIPLESAVAEETSEVTKQEVKPEASVADLLREEIAKGAEMLITLWLYLPNL